MIARLLMGEFSDRIGDTCKVVLPNGIVLAAVTLARLNQVLTFVSVSITILYAVWRWRKDVRKGDKS
jgi:hypothetical protein